MLHVFGIDEDFIGAALLMLRIRIEDDVVDGNVQRMFRLRGFDLVGRTEQNLPAARHFRACSPRFVVASSSFSFGSERLYRRRSAPCN